MWDRRGFVFQDEMLCALNQTCKIVGEWTSCAELQDSSQLLQFQSKGWMWWQTVNVSGTNGMLMVRPCGAFSQQPLNYERKKTYTLHIEGLNTHADPRFTYLGPFKDTATLKISVGDVDEAPVFSMDYYILDVYENSPSGTEVGTVTARDPDGDNKPVRWDSVAAESENLFIGQEGSHGSFLWFGVWGHWKCELWFVPPQFFNSNQSNKGASSGLWLIPQLHIDPHLTHSDGFHTDLFRQTNV